MIAKSTTNPIFLSARKGAEAAAKELAEKHGVPIEIVWMTPDDEDGQIQAQQIAQAVKDGVSAILISCSDADKVTGAINEAVDRGVPVMTFDSDAAESKRFAFYGVDDEKIGRDADARAGCTDAQEGLGGDPRGKRERAEPAQARGRRQEGSRAESGHQDRRHLLPHRKRARTRPKK